jgi:alginate O-acetyltransferase complex protein AlgJ
MPDTPDPLAPEEPSRLQAARPPRALGATLAVLALVFFGAPLVLILLGASGSRIEGERAAHVPRLDEGWELFDTGAVYLAEHLPGRARAVKANNFIAKDVLGGRAVYGIAAATGTKGIPSENVTPPKKPTENQTGGAAAGHAPVLEGRNGWTFLQGDLDVNCHPGVRLGTALRRWTRLVSIIRASGRPVVLLLAPEKSTIYPENLHPGTLNGDCALAAKRRAWSRLERSGDPDVIPLRRPLLALKRSSGEQLYFSDNSHWNDLGGIVLARRALDHLGGGRVRLRPDEQQRGTGEYASDLARFYGEGGETARTPTIRIERRGDDRVHAGFGKAGRLPVVVNRHAPGPAPVLRGTTVFIHDSYGAAPVAMLTHYAERLVDFTWPIQHPEDIVPVIRSADTVMIEAVERSFWKLPGVQAETRRGSVLSPRRLTRLERALSPR